MNSECDKFAICGLTANGDIFRPSNWAERLATTAVTLSPGRRYIFNPLVNLRTIEGINSIVIDKKLVSNDPELFAFFMGFGKSNNLIIRCEKYNLSKMMNVNEKKNFDPGGHKLFA